jgi:hypothetical protein
MLPPKDKPDTSTAKHAKYAKEHEKYFFFPPVVAFCGLNL